MLDINILFHINHSSDLLFYGNHMYFLNKFISICHPGPEKVSFTKYRHIWPQLWAVGHSLEFLRPQLRCIEATNEQVSFPWINTLPVQKWHTECLLATLQIEVSHTQELWNRMGGCITTKPSGRPGKLKFMGFSNSVSTKFIIIYLI